MSRQYEKTHSRSVRATVPIPAHRFVNRNGALGGIGVIGVSESVAPVGDDVALITGYSALVEAATPIAVGDIIDTDATGRAVGKPGGIGLGIAESPAMAGGLFEVRLGLIGVDPASVVTASVNPLAGGAGMGVAPSGTIAADGTVTLGTALPAVFDDGLWLYFPAEAFASPAAGSLRWVVMSSTTVGVARDGPAGDIVVGSGVAYSGVNAEVEVGQIALGLSALRKTGIIAMEFVGVCSGSTNSKTLRLRAEGEQLLWAGISTASQTYFRAEARVTRVASDRWLAVAGNGGGTSYGAIREISDGFANISVTLQTASAADFAIVFLTPDLQY